MRGSGIHRRGWLAAAPIFLLLLGSGAQGPVVGPAFSAVLDGRPFEPATAFATFTREASGESVRIVLDEIATECGELEELRGRRVVIGPMPYRIARAVPASIAAASHLRIAPDGRVTSARFTSGSVRIREGSREPPSVPFEIQLELDEGPESGNRIRGEALVTPCVIPIP